MIEQFCLQLEFVVGFFGALGLGAGVMDDGNAAEWFAKIADCNGSLDGFGGGRFFMQNSADVDRGHHQLAGARQVQRAGANLRREKFGVQFDIPEPGVARHRNYFAEHVSERFAPPGGVLLKDVSFHG